MRIAIISDSHGNLTALDAVLDELDRTGPYDQILMGGDVAFGGPFPAECVQRIIDRAYPTVRGNTDQMIIDAAGGGGGAHANWVVEQLTDAHLAFLKSLPVQHNVPTDAERTLGLVHATPWSIYDSIMPDSGDFEFRRMLSESETAMLAYGHIHLQHQRPVDKGLVVGVGSLGLPFDGDQRAMYTVIDSAARGVNVEFRRLAYDVEKAISEAKARGGPNGEAFATNLTRAKRPD